MAVHHGVPGGASHPGPRRDEGAMTVEAAYAILALVAVTLTLAWCLSLLGGQLAVGEASRAAARVAARGDDPAAVVREARRLVGDASVEIRADGGHVVVVVSRSVRPPGGLALWGVVRLHAESVAAIEAP